MAERPSQSSRRDAARLTEMHQQHSALTAATPARLPGSAAPARPPRRRRRRQQLAPPPLWRKCGPLQFGSVCVCMVCVCVYTGVRLANPQATCPRLGLPASPASRRRPPAHRETCCRPCRSAATPGTAAPLAAAPRPSPQHRCAPRRPLRGVPSTAAGSHGFPSQPQQQRSGCSWAAGRVLALGTRSRPGRHGARGACAGRPRTVATQQGGELPWRLHRAAAVWEPAAGEAREDPVHHHQRLRQRAPRLVKPAQGHKHAALAQAAQLGPRGSGVGTVGADAEHGCIQGAEGKEGGVAGVGAAQPWLRK